MTTDKATLISSDTADLGYRYPFPPYPNGWFPIEVSAKLAPGRHVSKHVLGRDVVIYRTESGVANVIGAYCPHLGAHIGKGGAVVGERIRCPFHHWEFELDGRCGVAFGAKKTPEIGATTYPMVEKNGTIFMWVDSQNREPFWEIPDLEETTSDDFVFVGYHEFTLKTHPQEMFENLSDFLHFRTLHGWSPVEFDWRCVYGEPAVQLNFNVANNDSNIRTTSNIQRMNITSTGPSYNYARYFGAFRALAILMFCPTFPGVMYNPILFWADKSAGKESAEAWMQGYLHDYSLDIDVLENKLYVENPKMSDADGPIHKMRKWYSQWYE